MIAFVPISVIQILTIASRNRCCRECRSLNCGGHTICSLSYKIPNDHKYMRRYILIMTYGWRLEWRYNKSFSPFWYCCIHFIWIPHAHRVYMLLSVIYVRFPWHDQSVKVTRWNQWFSHIDRLWTFSEKHYVIYFPVSQQLIRALKGPSSPFRCRGNKRLCSKTIRQKKVEDGVDVEETKDCVHRQ